MPLLLLLLLLLRGAPNHSLQVVIMHASQMYVASINFEWTSTKNEWNAHKHDHVCFDLLPLII